MISLLSIFPISINALCTINLNVETKIEIENKEAVFLPGKELNIKMKELAGDDTSTLTNGYNFKDENILAVKYSSQEPIDSNKEEKNIVSTSDSKYLIYMWYEDGTIYWWSKDSHPNLNENSSYLFKDFNKLEDISGLKFFNLSSVKDISYCFYSCKISDLTPIGKWNMSSVDSIVGMFYDTKIYDLTPLKDWNISNVTNMYGLFRHTPIVSLSGLESWDTSKVKIMGGVVYECDQLKDVKAIKNWNTSSATTIRDFFSCCFSLEEIDLSNWDTSNVTTMFSMFGMWDENGRPSLESNLKKIILSEKFDTSNVTNFSNFLANNTKIEDYSFLKYLDTSKAKSLYTFLQNNYNFKDSDLQYIKDYDISNVTSLQYTFFKTAITTVNPLRNWNTSNVENMNYTFGSIPSLTNLNGLENWNVSKVTNMNSMFYGDSGLTDVSSINDWDITKVTDFTDMLRSVPTRPQFTKVQGTWNSSGTFTPTP